MGNDELSFATERNAIYQPLIVQTLSITSANFKCSEDVVDVGVCLVDQFHSYPPSQNRWVEMRLKIAANALIKGGLHLG